MTIESLSSLCFPETFKAVENNQAEALIVAIENSLYGGINQVYDLIEKYGYPIIGEIHLPIHHQLISKGTADTITDIYSHPVALAQCETYLDTHFPHAERHEYHDTAAAVAHIKQLNNPATAAIASEVAAHMHTMPIVASNIEDNPANFTRFLVLQPDGAAPKDANRTSLVLTTGNTPGSLAQILTIFAAKNINLSKLQSYHHSDASASPESSVTASPSFHKVRTASSATTVSSSARSRLAARRSRMPASACRTSTT